MNQEIFLLFCSVLFDEILCLSAPTQTRPIPGILRKYRRWPWYFLFLFLDFLHRLLGHEAAPPLGRVFLHFPGDVGVGVQSEARAVVPQDAGDRFGVHTLLDRQRGESVTQPVEGDVIGDACLLQKVLVQPP